MRRTEDDTRGRLVRPGDAFIKQVEPKKLITLYAKKDQKDQTDNNDPISQTPEIS